MIPDAQDAYDATAHAKGRRTTAERERVYVTALEQHAWALGLIEAACAPTTSKEQEK